MQTAFIKEYAKKWRNEYGKDGLVTFSRSALFPPGHAPTHKSAPPSSQRIRNAHI